MLSISRCKFGMHILLIAGTLLLNALHSPAQTVQSNLQGLSSGDAFKNYHNALTSAAIRILATAEVRLVEGPLNNLSASPEPMMGAPPIGVDEVSGAIHGLSRFQQLRPMLERILREEGVPAELAAIVFVESRGQSTVLSPKGAFGIWQFMPDTARHYGLMVTPGFDERLDIYKSTKAAARYLRDLHIQFGDWSMALAAYNAGEDKVQRAIDRTSSHDFTLIARRGMLPRETRAYVSAVLKVIDSMEPKQQILKSTLEVD